MVRKLQLCTNCLGMAGCCQLSGSLSAAGMAGCCLRRSGSQERQVAGERICGVGEQWGERAAREQHASLRAEEAGGGEEDCCGTVEECSGLLFGLKSRVTWRQDGRKGNPARRPLLIHNMTFPHPPRVLYCIEVYWDFITQNLP